MYIVPYISFKGSISMQINNIYTNRYINAYIKVLQKIVSIVGNPSIIHGCSDYVNPLVGSVICKELKIPLVYEVRGLWHLSRLSYNKRWKKDDSYKRYVKMERLYLKKADHIFAISQEIKDEIIKNYRIYLSHILNHDLKYLNDQN